MPGILSRSITLDDKLIRLWQKSSFLNWMEATDGSESVNEYACRKHPVSADEILGWLDTYKFEILNIFGDRNGTLYMPESEQAIFWAKKAIG